MGILSSLAGTIAWIAGNNEAPKIKTVMNALKSDKVDAILDLDKRWYLSYHAGEFLVQKDNEKSGNNKFSILIKTTNEEKAVETLIEDYSEDDYNEDVDELPEIKTVTDVLKSDYLLATINCVNKFISFKNSDDSFVVSMHTTKRKSMGKTEELLRTTNEETAVAKLVEGLVSGNEIKTILDAIKNRFLSVKLMLMDKWLVFDHHSNNFVVNMDDNSRPNHVVELIKTTSEEEAVAKLIEGYYGVEDDD